MNFYVKFVAVLFITIIFMFGCNGVKQQEYDNLKRDFDALTISSDETKQELLKVGAYTKSQDSIISERVNDVFELEQVISQWKRTAKNKDTQITQLIRLGKVNQIKMDNLYKTINTQNKEYVLLEGAFADSTTYLNDSISYLTSLIAHVYYNGYVIDKNKVLDYNKTLDWMLIEQRKLYEQCKSGKLENIGPCTCNDLLGELKELEGKKWVIDKFTGSSNEDGPE